jgi:hypothetical protein
LPSKLDIVQIMGQFVQASYAASRCIKPDQTLSRFSQLQNGFCARERKGEKAEQSDQQIVERSSAQAP